MECKNKDYNKNGGSAMKTYMAKGETVERKWYVVDADGMTLGRLASQVAAILRGKNNNKNERHQTQ